MMKFWMMLVGIVVVLSGCSNPISNPIKGNAEIDWVDFVELGSNSYTGSQELVISNPDSVSNDIVGEVKFKVADVVTNSNYRTQSGDAAFLEIGTKLYRVDGFETDQLIAAQDENIIGGYRLYVTREFADTLTVHYKDVDKDKVERIELYHYRETANPINELKADVKNQFIELLDTGKESPDYNPNTKNGDSIYYSMVFYTDGPLAYSYILVDDHINVFFHPWNTRILDDEIRKWFQSI